MPKTLVMKPIIPPNNPNMIPKRDLLAAWEELVESEKACWLLLPRIDSEVLLCIVDWLTESVEEYFSVLPNPDLADESESKDFFSELLVDSEVPDFDKDELLDTDLLCCEVPEKDNEFFSVEEAGWPNELDNWDELSILEVNVVELEDSIEVTIELLLTLLEDSGICWLLLK